MSCIFVQSCVGITDVREAGLRLRHQGKQTDETKSTETLNSITQHIFDIYLLHVGAHKTFSLLFKLW